MITAELVSYIKKQIDNNISKDLIITKLVKAGWHLDDIDEGFKSVESELKPKAPEVNKVTEDTNIVKNNQVNTFADRYHEPIEGENIFEVKMEPHKAEPTAEEPVIELPVIKPVVEVPKVEPVIEIPVEIKQEEPKIEPVVKSEAPKVWVPMSVPVKEIASPAIEIQNLELPSSSEEIIKPLKTEESPNKVSLSLNPKYFNKGDEFIPGLVPKPVINSFGSIKKNDEKKQEVAALSLVALVDSEAKSLPKIAMLSSYKSDLMSVSKAIEATVKTKKSKYIRWSVMGVVVLIILGVGWMFASGFINIKNLSFPFVKKDPKTLLLSNSTTLSLLKSYKTETNIEISSPSFANIAYGLVSGQAVTSPDKDSFSINTLGIINQNDKGLLSDNFVTVKSSLLQDYITTDIKNDGTDLYVSVPDLSSILKDSAPEPAIVKIGGNQFDLIPSLFSPNIESELKKINIYKLLSNGTSSFINKDTLSVYNEFISSSEIVGKGEENIKGVDTYHYSINTDRQLVKKLLTTISSNFVSNLSSDDADRVTQILSATTVDSLDVWIGKGDNNIYQYNVTLDIPLSKIIGFEDRSIGDNIIKVTWKTTYYDYNIPNNILMPDTATPITDFVNSINEIKMKNEISSFQQLAVNLSKADGGFGKSASASGSCMNPSGGSLFSPTGHSKGAATAVGQISSLLNNILGVTNGAGFCYSTPKAWSFSVPISDNYDPAIISTTGYQHYFCIDNAGGSMDLITPQTGVICK